MYRGLVSRYLRPALAVAWEFTNTLDDAEDVVQETFCRVVRALPRFDLERPFAPWFFTILRNVARNAAGARVFQLGTELDDSTPDAVPTPAERVEYLDLATHVDAQLDVLPDMQRACFRLCVLEGFSSQEVAGALGVSDRTVRTHVFRARQALRKTVRPFVEEPSDDVPSS